MAVEAGHVQIQEFTREVIPQINWMLEDLFCRYGVAMPYFLLDFDFPDYSQRPEWVTGYIPDWQLPEWYSPDWKAYWPTWMSQWPEWLPTNGFAFGSDWGEWGYYLPSLNELLGLLFDAANLPREMLPDLSPASMAFFNDYVNVLYETLEWPFPPYIRTLSQLQQVKDYLSTDFILLNDIDASDTSSWNAGAGFEPIGNSTTKFSGSLNGQGYKIENLHINRPDEAVGLFRCLSGSISNLQLLSVDIRGGEEDIWNVGAIVADNKGGTITKCCSSGIIQAGSSGCLDIGGIVGWNRAGTISKCFSTATIIGDCPGGVVGYNLGSSGDAVVRNCYYNGDITGNGETYPTGGVVGYNNDVGAYSGTIEKCYSAGNVVGIDWVGGLIGLNRALIQTCHSTCAVSGTGENVDDLIGLDQGDSVGNEWNTDAEMKQQDTFAGWDFDTIWDIVVGSYPHLR